MATTILSHCCLLCDYYCGPLKKYTKSPQMEFLLHEIFLHEREQQDDQKELRHSVLCRG